jgi:LysR family glycine cleavage system transcriptional activator
VPRNEQTRTSKFKSERNLPSNAAANSTLVIEKLIELSLVPVCSPRLIEMHGPLERPEALKRVG